MDDQFSPNPYANFDPSQWLNPYSLYNKQALPWPTQYVGAPTNALGQPIQPQGVTLNQNPVASAAAPATAAATPPTGWIQSRNPYMNNPSAQATRVLATGDPRTPGWNSEMANNLLTSGYQAPTATTAQTAAPTAGSSGQDYLSLLANPGKVVTPGAQTAGTMGGSVGSGASTQPGPGVLQAFLQDWKPAQAGPGSGFQQNFYNTLKGMGY
jgi:hypothetical protein